ncbi:hypothetical protein ACFLZV_00245 [Candidatus Margulisiibacteriota bacterium]
MVKNILRKIFKGILSLDKTYPRFIRIADHLFTIPCYTDNKRFEQLYPQIIVQGLANAKVIPYNPNRIWPFWVYQQLNPESQSYSSSGFPFALINTTHRNWSSISLPSSDTNAIIDPRGLITPLVSGWSMDNWIRVSGKLYSPAKLADIEQQYLLENKPIIITKWKAEQLNICSETFLSSFEQKSIVFNQLRVTNTSDETKKFSLYFAVRPYNPEGLAPIDEIVYTTSQALIIDGRLSVVFDQKPDNVICLRHKDGDVSEEHVKNWEMIPHAKCKDHLASAYAEYRLVLQPNEEKALTCKLFSNNSSRLVKMFQKSLPISQKVQLRSKITMLQKLNYHTERINIRRYWQNNASRLARISIPNKKLETCFNQNIAHLQNFVGKKDIFSGSFTNKKPWVTDSVLSILALNRIGAFDLAKKSVESLLRKKNPFRISSSVDKAKNLDILGQLLFIIYDYYSFTKDKDFLVQHFSNIKVLTTKIKKSLYSTRSQKKVMGLMNKTYSCDNLGLLDNYMWDNFWTLAGVKVAKKLAKILDKEDLLTQLSAMETKITNYVEKYISRISATKSSTPHIPVSPNRLMDSALITALIGIHPLNILDPHSHIISNTLSQLEKHFLSDNIYFNNLNHTGFNIAHNCLLAQIYLYRQDPKLFTIISWLIKNISGTGAWPEAIHPKSLGGSAGDGHYSTATAEFIMLIRNLLLKEEEKVLHITPILPREWLKKDTPLQVTNLPTHFGMVSYDLCADKNNVYVEFDNNFSTPPASIKISLPHSIKYIVEDGKQQDVYKTSASISPQTKKLKIVLLPE